MKNIDVLSTICHHVLWTASATVLAVNIPPTSAWVDGYSSAAMGVDE